MPGKGLQAIPYSVHIIVFMDNDAFTPAIRVLLGAYPRSRMTVKNNQSAIVFLCPRSFLFQDPQTGQRLWYVIRAKVEK
jgi:hypothetical protein